MRIVVLSANEFYKEYLRLHREVFPNDELEEWEFKTLLEELELMVSRLGAKLLGLKSDDSFDTLIMLSPSSFPSADCKVDVISLPQRFTSEHASIILDTSLSYCSKPYIVIPSASAILTDFLEKKFRLISSFVRMRVYLEEFKFEVFKDHVSRLRSQGFIFNPLLELKDIDSVIRLVQETMVDEPTGLFKFSVDQVVGDADLNASYVALREGYVVAVTLVSKVNRSAYYTYTGVKRPYRGLGIAKALKALSLNMLKEEGIKKAYTSNNKINIPIMRVNTSLGFKIVREYLAFLYESF